MKERRDQTTAKIYSGPIAIDHIATLFAVAYRKGFAPSPTTAGTYIVGAPPRQGLSTFHVGNSLTGTTLGLSRDVLTAGAVHDCHAFMMGGASNAGIWKTYVVNPAKPNHDKVTWDQALASLHKVDDFTLQVSDPNLESEAEYDTKFFNTVRGRFPEMQPWFYPVWIECSDIGTIIPWRPWSYAEMGKAPARAVTLGQVSSFEMKTLYPALTCEEAAAARQLFAEDVKTKVLETYPEGKKPRVLPTAIAVAWLKNRIDHGQISGISPDMYPFIMFRDNFHPGPIGVYLINLVWYAAFYGESPVGKVRPVNTELSPEQAAYLQHLAWDVKNYPDCGLYEKGNAPVAKPHISLAPGKIDGVSALTLSSATEGAWFRYTLDGTEPTRTCGYIYCGVVSMRPGMTLKAVAYKSGMADSPVTEVREP